MFFFYYKSRYISDILAKHGLADCNPISTPQDSHTASFRSSSSTPSLPFCNELGELLYLTTTTRPDIAFTVTLLSRHLNNPEEEHQHISKRVLRYLHGTKDYGLMTTSFLEYRIDMVQGGGCRLTELEREGCLGQCFNIDSEKCIH
ncbi:hypothetical protein AeRB84_016239 [Aphanomyces euteiches]|nr:hypothetical protein AeRB84_016239 [Aphanomyces euteiches]